MKSFKEQLEEDFDSTFFNPAEFAEPHLINDESVLVVVDNDTLMELNLGKNADADGIFTDDKMFFVQKKNLDFEPVAGQHMKFDGEYYIVSNVIEDFGGYTIVLTGNED